MTRSTEAVLYESATYWERPVAGVESVFACRWEHHADEAGPGRVQRVLPDGCADVIVVDAQTPRLVGPANRVALPELAPGTTVVGLRVRAEAIRAVFGVPGSELRDRTRLLDEVVGPRRAAQVAGALARAGAGGGDAGLRAWVAEVAVDRRTAAAVRRLWAGADRDVADVAEAVGLSGRQLRRVLLADVGLGPKALQRIGRLQRFLRLAEAHPRPGGRTDLAGWAAMAGYSDQSHLNRDVAELAATTPARLLTERQAPDYR